MKRLLVALAAAWTLSNAFALQIPKACGNDARVRCVVYNPDEVVEITAMFGYQTTILFGTGEEVEDMGGGDTEGWDIGVITRKNGIFIKPKSFKPATNITIITNKRHYNFDFRVENLKNAEERNFMTRFKYPDDEAKAAKAVSSKGETEKLLASGPSKKHKNDDYWAEGSDAFMPTAAWDDGETTYFRFAPNTDIPAVYLVDEQGKETLLNKNFPEPYTMAVQLVGKKFVFRRNEIFTCIYNESFDRYGVENLSRTQSPGVRRTIREERRNQMDRDAEPKSVTYTVPTPANGQGAVPMMPAMPQGAPAGMPQIPQAVPQTQTGSGIPTIDLTKMR